MNVTVRRGFSQKDIPIELPPAPGGATDVAYILERIAGEHGSKNVSGMTLLVNSVRATPQTPVPDGAVITIARPLRAGLGGIVDRIRLFFGMDLQ
jgi:hypothetical protein